MGWERRKGSGNQYYTRSRRINGGVVRVYIGTGARGEAAAQDDRDRRRKRQSEAEQRAAEEVQLDALEAPVAELSAAVDTLVRQELEAAGYHQHHRGEWRRTRYEQA